MNHRHRRHRRIALVILAVGGWIAAVGCAPPQDLRYTPRADIKGVAVEIPDKHREQIAKYLEDYFGSPASPRMRVMAASEGGASDESPAGEKKPAAPVKWDEKADRQELKHGALVYRQQCASCHGISGDGQGPAAKHLNPPPRDYRLGRFKFASTPRGMKPRQEDLERIIRRGAKGTSMPSFRWMADEDLAAVIKYVKLLSNRGELELKLIYDSQQELDEGDDYDPEQVAGHMNGILASWDEAAKQIVLPLTVRPAYDEQSVRLGAEAFVKLECVKCHGKDGRGNKKFNVGPDDWGRIAFAADLTSGMLHGGRRPIDIYRRIYTGINATPMPSFKDPDSGKGETVEQRSEKIWHLVHFVTSIVEGKPLPEDVIDEAIKSMPAAGAAAPPADGATPPATEGAATDAPASTATPTTQEG